MKTLIAAFALMMVCTNVPKVLGFWLLQYAVKAACMGRARES
jgi:hypothetical protein